MSDNTDACYGQHGVFLLLPFSILPKINFTNLLDFSPISLTNYPGLTNCASERSDPSTVLTGIFRLCHHWSTDMARITGGSATVSAYICLFNLRWCTKMGVRLCCFSTGSTSIDSCYLCLFLFDYLLVTWFFLFHYCFLFCCFKSSTQ